MISHIYFRITCKGGCINVTNAIFFCTADEEPGGKQDVRQDKTKQESLNFKEYVKEKCDGRESCIINNKDLTEKEKDKCFLQIGAFMNLDPKMIHSDNTVTVYHK